MDTPLYLLLLSLKPTTTISAAFFLLFLVTPSAADPDTEIGSIAVTSAPPQLQPPAVKTAAFKPSIIIIVGVLTTLFALTFLLLLYAKHCRRGGVLSADSGPPRGAELRKNSGIDRAVVESLPVFRFGSLRGHKDGLDCAVCLTRFEPTEVLRLLPKCKHAFHVECVDTWLDAHSTCPLCRYRVDPEDILLIDQPPANDVVIDVENTETDRPRRVSGRHSSALERKQPGSGNESHHTRSSLRRSFDGWTWFWKKNESTRATGTSISTTSADRSRKDGLLLPQDKVRLEHRIIVSSPRTSNQRWSDVESSDLLYLKSEMIMSDRETTTTGQINEEEEVGDESSSNGGSSGKRSGRGVIKERSMSEITGLSRFSSRGGNNSSSSRSNNGEDQKGQPRQKQNRERQQQRQLRLASRWKTWISSRQPPGPSAPPPPPPLSASPSTSSSNSSSAKGTPPRIPRPPPLPSTVV